MLENNFVGLRFPLFCNEVADDARKRPSRAGTGQYLRVHLEICVGRRGSPFRSGCHRRICLKLWWRLAPIAASPITRISLKSDLGTTGNLWHAYIFGAVVLFVKRRSDHVSWGSDHE